MSERRAITTARQVVVNRSLPGCTGCRVCEQVCAIQHEQELNPEYSRIKVYQLLTGPVDVPIVCQYCQDRPCAAACPTSAIVYDEKSGIMKVDEALCTGCLACNQACVDAGRGGAITFHPTKGTAQVCDLCGGDSQCVKYCPNNVLILLPASSLSKRLAKPVEYIAERIVEQFHPASRSPV